jgi:hypothetical protein
MLGLMTASPLVSASLARNPKPTATPSLEEVCSPHVDMAADNLWQGTTVEERIFAYHRRRSTLISAKTFYEK